MKTTTLIAASLLTVVLATGCTKERSPEKQHAHGELRHKLFVECMELSAKNVRKADDDVGDIVSECSSQSWYMANGIIGS